MPLPKALDRANRDGGTARSLLGSTLALATSLAALTAVTTSALFTETDVVGANSFTTGSVDIATDPTSQIVYAAAAMAPGDSTSGQVTVSNTGSLAHRYAITSSTTEDALAAQLEMTVWAEAAETAADGTCDATPAATTLYASGDLGSVAGTNVVGDPTQGAQAGDRELVAADSEVLCFLVALPTSTGNAFEGLTTTASFAFVAEQTANNA